MSEDFSTSEKLTSLLKAYNEFQSLGLVAKKQGLNTHFKSTYAKLPDVLKLVEEPLANHGLSVIQMPLGGIDVCRLLSRLTHISGEWMQWVLTTPIVKKDPQGIAAATTYLRRISLTACLGLPEEDDDGSSVSTQESSGQTKPVNYDEPDLPPISSQPRANEVRSGGPSEKQLKRLFAIMKGNGYEVYQVDGYIAQAYKLQSKTQLNKTQYDTLCNMLESRTLPQLRQEVPSNGSKEPDYSPMEDDQIPF